MKRKKTARLFSSRHAHVSIHWMHLVLCYSAHPSDPQRAAAALSTATSLTCNIHNSQPTIPPPCPLSRASPPQFPRGGVVPVLLLPSSLPVDPRRRRNRLENCLSLSLLLPPPDQARAERRPKKVRLVAPPPPGRQGDGAHLSLDWPPALLLYEKSPITWSRVPFSLPLSCPDEVAIFAKNNR
jgi:hypothetical protein